MCARRPLTRNNAALNKYQLLGWQIKDRIQQYGFTEMADIQNFLEIFCKPQLDNSDYLYIRGKVADCLKEHDNHCAYFIPLRELAAELDCLIQYPL